MSNRIAVYIDGPNFFYMQKDGLSWFVDPKKILEWVKRRFNGDLVDARYYQSIDPMHAAKGGQFLKALPYMGYSLHTKNVKTINDGNEQWNESNITIGMMLDIWDAKDQFDCLVLVSGSGDFEEIVERLRSRGKQVAILATHGFLSGDLRSKVGQWFIDFSTIQNEVQKDQKP
tara:strand:- start:3430 stop:3948 length:519 start_codon:yes stop_codon:yes gene_type:complete